MLETLIATVVYGLLFYFVFLAVIFDDRKANARK